MDGKSKVTGKTEDEMNDRLLINISNLKLLNFSIFSSK
jgi:hypothetical protein